MPAKPCPHTTTSQSISCAKSVISAGGVRHPDSLEAPEVVAACAVPLPSSLAAGAQPASPAAPATAAVAPSPRNARRDRPVFLLMCLPFLQSVRFPRRALPASGAVPDSSLAVRPSGIVERPSRRQNRRLGVFRDGRLPRKRERRPRAHRGNGGGSGNAQVGEVGGRRVTACAGRRAACRLLPVRRGPPHCRTACRPPLRPRGNLGCIRTVTPPPRLPPRPLLPPCSPAVRTGTRAGRPSPGPAWRRAAHSEDAARFLMEYTVPRTAFLLRPWSQADGRHTQGKGGPVAYFLGLQGGVSLVRGVLRHVARLLAQHGDVPRRVPRCGGGVHGPRSSTRFWARRQSWAWPARSLRRAGATDAFFGLPAVGAGAVCYLAGFVLFGLVLVVEGFGSAVVSAAAGLLAAVGTVVLCIAWGTCLAQYDLRQALANLALMIGMASVVELLLAAVAAPVGMAVFAFLLVLGVALPVWKAARGELSCLCDVAASTRYLRVSRPPCAAAPGWSTMSPQTTAAWPAACGHLGREASALRSLLPETPGKARPRRPARSSPRCAAWPRCWPSRFWGSWCSATSWA